MVGGEEIHKTAEDAHLPPAVRLQEIYKNFRHVQAIDGVTLAIKPGEVVALLGPNGAGKTSTIDIILGLSKPDSGTVSVFGIAPVQAIRRGLISAVMQNGGLLKDLTVAETVEYTSKLFVTTRPAREVMERAGITDIANRLVAKCSGGEQQRLRFAMALLSDPELIILDEPTQGMDVEGRHQFWQAIRDDASLGRTILFATHYLQEADSYADRVVLMRKGKIVADGTAVEIKSMGKRKVVRAHLSNPEISVLSAIDGVTEVVTQGEAITITCSESDLIARYLLTQTNAKNLEISSVGLEEAFLALTGESQQSSWASSNNRGILP
ncbi:MAG: ABC transporter ATP-binding protein [Actinobacteria bacterium]|jgi:ABC-2 type transport system ATP-binding protein|nr:ABC transporter ATP-binding protein [Actinomycetota bacterium]